MMDIHQEWKNVEAGEDKVLSAMLDLPLIMKLPSRDPLSTIRRQIFTNGCWGLLIGIGYTIVLFRFPYWQILASFGTVVVLTFFGVAKTFLLYRQMRRPAEAHTVLAELERHHHNIGRWMNLQQWGGLVMYPIIITGGFMLGLMFGSGKPIDVFMQKPGMILALLITVAVLVPICFFLARWMNEKAFGQYARQLKRDIEELKNA